MRLSSGPKISECQSDIVSAVGVGGCLYYWFIYGADGHHGHPVNESSSRAINHHFDLALLGKPLTIGPMLAEPYGIPYPAGDAPKLRTACENCRQSKVKCNLSGKNACTRCLRHGLECQYGFANRSGKPKGSKNRATLRKLGQLQEEKPGCRLGSRQARGPVANMEPLSPTAYTSRLSEPLNDDVGPFLSFVLSTHS